MSSHLFDISSRKLSAFMEHTVLLPNRPDLRYAPKVAQRGGSDVCPKTAVGSPAAVVKR